MEIWTEIDSPDIIQELTSRLDALRKLPFNHLREMPEFSEESVRIGEMEVTFTTYRNTEDNGNVGIVVQARIPRRDGVLMKHAQVLADGFKMTCNGKTEPLPKKVLYSYM